MCRFINLRTRLKVTIQLGIGIRCLYILQQHLKVSKIDVTTKGRNNRQLSLSMFNDLNPRLLFYDEKFSNNRFLKKKWKKGQATISRQKYELFFHRALSLCNVVVSSDKGYQCSRSFLEIRDRLQPVSRALTQLFLLVSIPARTLCQNYARARTFRLISSHVEKHTCVSF